MKDRTREAVFNLISTDSKEAHVIDLFSGTGALAIEAVSRGAVSAVLVEVHLQTLRNLRQNVEELRLQEQCPLVQADAFFFVKAMDRKYFPADRRWLVFCSPPYDFYKSQLAEMTGMLTTLYTAAPVNSAFVVEAETSFDFDLLQFPDADARFRAYPPAKIGVYRKTNTLGNGSPV
jgi:16S rRNA (guanine966-N2)-methyltransferase